jgi:hypothetical protein
MTIVLKFLPCTELNPDYSLTMYLRGLYAIVGYNFNLSVCR